MKLVIIGTNWCSFCKAMKKARVAERFLEQNEDFEIKLEEFTLPDDWEPGSKEESEAWTKKEKQAVKLANDLGLKGVPFVGFFNSQLNAVFAENAGAVTLKELEKMYVEAVHEENPEDEDDDDDDDD